MRPSFLPFGLLVLALVLASAPARAGDAEAAAQAQVMLGAHAWARTLVIHNPRRADNLPPRVHATVFAFHGVLWLYIPRQGTQSLSHRRGRLDLDRDNLLPLLREIQPAFTGYEFVSASKKGAAVAGRFPKLRNGCFVESIHALARLLDQGVTPTGVGLFTVYVRGPRGPQGHTGLLYQTSDGTFFWDPDRPEAPVRVMAGFDDRERVARAVRSDARWEIVRTHFLPIEGDIRRREWSRPVVRADEKGPAEVGRG